MESVNYCERENQKLTPPVALLVLASVALAVFHGIKGDMSVAFGNSAVSYVIAALAVIAGAVMTVIAIKNKKYLSAGLSGVQVAVLVCFVVLFGNELRSVSAITIDYLASTVILITGLMGAIIMWRTGSGLPAMISVLGVDGLVLADNLILMYFFWTIITVSSYVLIMKDTDKAADLAARMMEFNAAAGLSFTVGIIVSGVIFETVEISTLNLIDTVYSDLIAVPAIFIVLAGIIRSMQMPFQRWYDGEHVTSAGTASLIQAVTLVNSGMLVIIKMAPAMGISNFAGLMSISAGAVTFFMASLDAITEGNVRKMLADSTSAIMGLALVCAGIGTSESIWAAIMLIIFHTVAKPLILAGTEYQKLRTDMVMAVIVMMIAPFAIVLLQRESMGSIADTGNILLIVAICFSGAMAVFYWTRWLGTLISTAVTEGIEPINLKEFNPMKANAWLIIILVVGLPLVSIYMVVPYMEGLYGGMSAAANLTDNILGALVISLGVALAAYPIYKGIRPQINNESEDSEDEHGQDVVETMRQSGIVVKVRKICTIASAAMMVICVGFVLVNLIGLLGGVL